MDQKSELYAVSATRACGMTLDTLNSSKFTFGRAGKPTIDKVRGNDLILRICLFALSRNIVVFPVSERLSWHLPVWT